ncbi:uncharacterized protein SAMN04515671_2220 [Nakamurella panacisegetis]|uniref:Asparagine synthetase domain-containing protein n=1 Tax=Nakamurella panacisegetis TaxID=1090615 RepID=A0A1H0N611_9ACTN|nr:ATP-dependent sacrificial sulfur transferase LarE [Nakamurella panacisegetis]SDO88112.1 uncharacterized protein SAMN04515671_2220 [Nakamurella panacisegetis]
MSADRTELPVPRSLSDGWAGVERLGVAFSGGVDSSVLLAAAVRDLGAGQVVAILGVSPSLAADEHEAARATAAHIGATLVEVQTHEGDNDAYRRNGPDRCFHCKDELFTRIDEEVLHRNRLDAIAYGENADDAVRPDRPGSRAATGHRVLRPLADAGLDKAAVRRLARSWRLPCADKPAAPCLASRIPHFDEVTPQKLAQIDRAESALRRLGLTDFRVRHHGDIARLELPAADLVRAAADPLRRQIRQAVLDAGFRYAAVDLGGLASGAFTLTVLASGA